MGKGQRKPKMEKIDKEQFEKFCSWFCKEKDIADIFGVSVDTLYSWCKLTYGMNFAECYLKFRAFGKTKLRQAQLNLAQKSAQMAIFLGEHYLEDQMPEKEQNTQEPVHINISIEDTAE